MRQGRLLGHGLATPINRPSVETFFRGVVLCKSHFERLVRRGHYCTAFGNANYPNEKISAVSRPVFLCVPTDQQQPQALPRIASLPSHKMSGTITRAAIGSAHLRCQIALIPRPARVTKAR